MARHPTALSLKYRAIKALDLLLSTWAPLSSDAAALKAGRADFLDISRPGLVMGRPAPVANVEDYSLAGVKVRCYTPFDSLSGTLLFFHGGGFAMESVDSHDILARAIACETRRRLVAVEYRLAPEHPFPAAVDDCRAVTRAVAREVSSGPLVICGDSAGGNLAAAIANDCALNLTGGPNGGPIPVKAQVLIYPVVDMTTERASCEEFKDGLLTRDRARWYKGLYTPDPAVRVHPDASPLLAAEETLQRAPPAYIALARCDVLHDEGVDYAHALRSAGVPVILDVTDGAPHAFASMLGFAESRALVTRICAWLEAQW